MELWNKAAIILLSCWIIVSEAHSYNTDAYCPKGCACTSSQKQKYYTAVKCTSQNIFTKFCQYDMKQPLHLTKVDLSDTHMKILNIRIINKLLHLQNLDVSQNHLTDLMHDLKTPELRHINLSNNRIKYISSTFFPKNVQTINLADNKLQIFPQNIQHLPALYSLKITGNVFECTCYNLEIYNALISAGVSLDNDECLNYGDVQIYKWHQTNNSITCPTNSDMLGDEPGSGDGKVLDYDNDNEEHNEDDSEEFIRVEHETQKMHSTTTAISNNAEKMTERTTTESDFDFDEIVTVSGPEFEGSGMPSILSEGSGLGGEVNLTSWTNTVVGSGDGSDDEDDTTNGTIFVDGSIINTEQNSSDIREAATTTEQIIVEKVPNLHHSKNADHSDDHINEELGEHVTDEDDRFMPAGLYAFTGILVIALVIGLACFIVNRKKLNNRRPSQNNNRRHGGNQDEEAGSELKELDKTVPFLSQENGNAKPLPSETTPMIPLIDADDPQEPPYTNGISPNGLDTTENGNGVMDPAPAEQPHNSYDPERVKIVMTELSDSIPKTPVLITRSRSPNGTEEIHITQNRRI